MAKKYVVELTNEERQQLLTLLKKGKVAARNRGRIAPRGAARAQVPRSAARRVPVSAWAAWSPGAGGRQCGV